MNNPPREPARILAVIAAALTIIFAIGFRGDFPLSDDWSYAFATKTLGEEGRIEFLPWTGASVIFQVAYGALLTAIFGFSFETLRISTLFFAVATALAFDRWLAHLGVTGLPRLLGLVVFAISPLHIGLAFTYMTDVPFTAFCVVAGTMYTIGLRDDDDRSLVAGSIATACALLIRQPGILVAAAATLACLFDHGRGRSVKRAVACAAVPTAVFTVFHIWLFAIHGSPAGVNNKIAEALAVTPTMLLDVGFRAWSTLGVFVIPVAIAHVFRSEEVGGRATGSRFGVAVLTLGALILFAYERDTMFYLTNIVYDFGIGALSLKDALVMGVPKPPVLGHGFRLCLTIAAIIGGAGLFSAGLRAALAFERPELTFSVLGLVGVYLGSLAQGTFYFDRYLLPIMPFAIAVCLAPGSGFASSPRTSHLLSGVFAAGLAFFAIAGTHDYMEWNRARYELIDTLESRGIGPGLIDGGMEYNSWFNAPESGTWPATEDVGVSQDPRRKSWWWVLDDVYVVSFSPIAEHVVRDTRRVDTWLGTHETNVLLLERTYKRDAKAAH